MRGVNLSHQSDTPIYQQLFEQISSQILNGELESEFGLPPIRTAAKELRVSVITVKKAWEELERAGLIYSVVGRGCFVAPLSNDDLTGKKDDVIREQLKKDLVFYRKLGVKKDELINLVAQEYEESANSTPG